MLFPKARHEILTSSASPRGLLTLASQARHEMDAPQKGRWLRGVPGWQAVALGIRCAAYEQSEACEAGNGSGQEFQIEDSRFGIETFTAFQETEDDDEDER